MKRYCNQCGTEINTARYCPNCGTKASQDMNVGNNNNYYPNSSKKVKHKMIYATMPHVSGLPIPNGVRCDIALCPDQYVFTYKKLSYNLSFDKIIDVSIKSEKEIQQHYVSSIGGAVLGGALLGPLGAIVGGRAKKKKTVNRRTYLIFTYESESTTKFIVFDSSTSLTANKFVRLFNKTQAKEKRVEL